MKQWPLPAAAFLVTLLASISAFAAPPDPARSAAAVALFDAADALFAEGRIREACDKYEESYRLDPQLGALLHWADCLETAGKLATAYAAFRDAADLARQKDDSRETVARERAQQLEPRISRVIVDAARADALPGFLVALGRVRIASKSLGVAIAMDPGPYSIEATAPGYEPFRTTITVAGEGNIVRVSVPELRPVRASAPLEYRTPARAATSAWSARSDGTRRAIGAGVGVFGVVSLGVGGGLFAKMLHSLGERERLCPRSPCERGTNVSEVRGLEEDARRSKALAIGFSAAGALSVVTGAVLYFSRPSTAAASSWNVELGRSHVSVSEAWSF